MTTYSFTDVSDLVYELQQFIDDQIDEAKAEKEEEKGKAAKRHVPPRLYVNRSVGKNFRF